MNNHTFECPACNKDLGFASNLNKHLWICEVYKEWIKTYKPPETINCKVCKRNFINLNNHKCKN